MRNQYTHYVKFHNIPCYYNINTDGITGINWFYSSLLILAILYTRYFSRLDFESSIAFGEELNEDDMLH